ncbi:hypothetical protein [Thalassobacillus hwangdonensis]|uniref:Phage tail protein n=1 Tax=Thalassobacillus hwangdonensis TaxID=546108 RepID=A0ABW3L265_9BACI
MAELGRFFNGPEYDSQDFSEFFQNFLSTGFFTGLEVIATDTMNVIIQPGSAFLEGHEYRNTTDLNKILDTANATYDRTDRVVVRKDSTPDAENPLQVFIRTGTPSDSPEPPELIRNDSIYEISLANILITAGKSFVEEQQITDERGDPFLCGRVDNPSRRTQQVDSVDVRLADAMPVEFAEGLSQFYLNGEDYPSIMLGWLNSIGVTPSDYGRDIGDLRAYVLTIGQKTNTAIQEFTLFAWDYSSNYEIYGTFRRATNAISAQGSWGKWQETVLEVESGSNANGHFVKYSNGVLECWGQPFSLATDVPTGSLYRSETQTWSYPSTFSDDAPIVVTGDVSSLNRWMAISGGTSGGQVGVRAMSSNQTTDQYSVWLRATGRWR